MEEVEKILLDIKKRNFSPIYYLAGEEPYFIDTISDFIEKNVLTEDERAFNQQVIYGKDITIDTLIHYAKEYPMMAEYRVIIVKEAQELSRTINQLLPYVENPSPTTILVLCYKYGKIDGKTKLAKELKKYVFYQQDKKLYENQVVAWLNKFVKKMNFEIEPTSAQMLVDYLGTDLSRIANEVNKLKIILPKGTTITPTHIEQNIGISKDFNVFELQSALGKKNLLKAMQIIQYFSENQRDNPATVIISNLYRYFEDLLKYHGSNSKLDKDLAVLLGKNPYFIKDYHLAGKNYPMKKVSQCIASIRETDMKSKGVESGSISYYDLFKELIINIIA